MPHFIWDTTLTNDHAIEAPTERPKAQSIVVVIPYYNGSTYIERAIKSVLAQTVPASEFVVVNDGSSQAETEFLHSLAKNYEFRIIDKENGGQGSARNAGVWATKAEYICFLDQDDYYLEHHNETLLKAIPEAKSRFGWVYGDLYEADSKGRVVTTAIVKYHGQHPKTSLFDLIRNDMHILPSASMISRSAFEAVGGFDEQFTGYEDDDLFMRLFRAGYSNAFIPTAVTAWCMHTSSTSYSIRMCRSRMRFFKKMLAEFPDEVGKGRFYMRDMLIPRFHLSFVGDALQSVIADSRNDIPLLQHQDELMDMLREYQSLVVANDFVSRSYKRKLAMLVRLLETRNPKIVKLAIASHDMGRRIVRR